MISTQQQTLQTCSGQQEEDDRQDIEGLPAGDSHLLVLMWEEGREQEGGREGGIGRGGCSALAGLWHPVHVGSSSHMAAAAGSQDP